MKDIAIYLGIDLSSLDTPVSVDEVREMAAYLGIDIKTEGYLLPLARMALQARMLTYADVCCLASRMLTYADVLPLVRMALEVRS